MPEVRLIDANTPKDKISNIKLRVKNPEMMAGLVEMKAAALREIENAPTIEAEPVRHGRWLQYSRNTEETYIECSECCVSSRPRHLQMVTRTGSGLPDYCPNCGAKMDGGAENG